VAAWLNSLTGSGKTVANKHAFLAGALNAAVRAGHLSANPCDGNRMRRDAPSEMAFVTHEEFALLHSCVSEHWRPLVEFLVASGARFGGVVRTIYDPAAGTGGMLSTADDYLVAMNPSARPVLYGQDINPRSYAMCKSDMIIKGQGVDNIYLGDTLTDDGYPGKHFDYLLSNSPSGWSGRPSRRRSPTNTSSVGSPGDSAPACLGCRTSPCFSCCT
jgi:hypothetical protein